MQTSSASTPGQRPRTRRLLRLGLTTFAALALLLTVVVLACFVLLRASAIDYDRTIAVAGVDGPLEIVRDRNAIPHIYAESLGDAYFGLGFAHAQDRLWQMEMMRAAARGRLSEIFGEATLATDKLTRTINSAQVAKRSLDRMSGQTRAYFQRYVDGINSFLDTRRGLLPPEFLLFSVEPAPWELEDTVYFFALVALGSDNWQLELLRADLSRHLSPEQIADLFPDYPRDAPLSHPGQGTGDRQQAPAAPGRSGQTVALTGLGPLIQLARQPLIAAYPASNTWVVDGSRTLSGKPLLASDPHGPLSAPADYYLARLSTPGLEITGVGYPGMPVFAIGHNRHIAWGLTDIIADTADLVAEKVVEDQPGYYHLQDSILPFEHRREVIRVKGREDVVITVRSTVHGPVISDVIEHSDLTSPETGEPMVLALSQATLKYGNTSGQAFMRINQAGDWAAFQDAMTDYEMAQNLSYADTLGNIGMISSARVPLRSRGDGFVISRGWTMESAVSDYLAPENMPTTLNPEQGFLVNANNKPEPWDYPYHISREHVAPFRAEAIQRRLLQGASLDVFAMQQLQGDLESLAATRLLPLLTDTPASSSRARLALALLRDWDLQMRSTRAEPLIYQAWERHLTRLLLADELAEGFATYNESRPEVLAEILTRKPQWCDDVQSSEIESCATMKARSLERALDELTTQYGSDMSGWTWGAAHHAEFDNAVFTQVPLLNRFSDILLASDGGPHTVNQARSDYNSETPYRQNYGPRYRQIIDLANLANSRYMIAPGVSGNPFSPYYGHLAGRWQKKQYLQFPEGKAALLDTAIGTTRLVEQ